VSHAGTPDSGVTKNLAEAGAVVPKTSAITVLVRCATLETGAEAELAALRVSPNGDMVVVIGAVVIVRGKMTNPSCTPGTNTAT